MVSHQPGLPVTGMHAGDVLIAGQCMAHKNGVGTLSVEFAIGLVGDLERHEIDAAVERVAADPRRTVPRANSGGSASCARSSVWIAGLGIDCMFTILTPTS